MGYNMNEEVWKDVIGFEGYYKVSSTGKVLSVRRSKLLKPKIDKDGIFDILNAFYILNTSQSSICIKYNLSPAQVSRIINGSRRKKEYKEFMENLYG